MANEVKAKNLDLNVDQAKNSIGGFLDSLKDITKITTEMQNEAARIFKEKNDASIKEFTEKFDGLKSQVKEELRKLVQIDDQLQKIDKRDEKNNLDLASKIDGAIKDIENLKSQIPALSELNTKINKISGTLESVAKVLAGKV